MANRNFYDGTDADLATGSQVFSTAINAAPADWGLQNAACTAYATLSGDYYAAWQTAINPETRTKGTVANKNNLRDALRAATRQLAGIIQNTPSVTNQMKANVGLHIRDSTPTPAPIPTVAPSVEISNAGGNTLKVILRDAAVQKRGKPPHVKASSTYYWVGEETPNENTPWVTFGTTGRTMFNMQFPQSLPAGTKVWVIVAWTNSRGQNGPASQPQSALLLGQAAPQQGNFMSIAA